MAQVVVFDVNETLLDLGGLDPLFARVFGDARVRREWFGELVKWALTSTIVGPYRDFGELAQGSLRAVAAQHRDTLQPADFEDLKERMGSLPPYDDVAPALERLRGAGARLAALTNSPAETAEHQLERSGLSPFFEAVVSADEIRRLKPARETYEHAAQRLGVSTADIRLVAAHGWDVVGADGAGCAVAFLARPGQTLGPLIEPPPLSADDLGSLADQIIARAA